MNSFTVFLMIHLQTFIEILCDRPTKSGASNKVEEK